MNRIALTALAIAGAITAARAEDAPAPSAAPRMDLSRSVTLTGYELQALIAAQIAQARAQDAAAAAQDATRKVNDALIARPN
jgi:hypothetical protein